MPDRRGHLSCCGLNRSIAIPRPPPHRLILGTLFVLCLVAALGFAGRTAYLLHYWSDPAHQAQSLEPWMTPRYVARSYAVDPRALGAALGVKPDRGSRPTLGALAAERGIGFSAYAAQVRAVIAHLQAAPDG